jgi:hypothetical protein
MDSKTDDSKIGIRANLQLARPWRPWTTAFFTRQWDVGPGEHGDFPAKWMSNDGESAYLVFSGNDCFSVRGAHLITSLSDD